MPLPLVLQLTDAGAAAVQAPAGSSTTLIAELGLTNTPFDFGPTLTALPGEFKRLPITSGVAAAPNVAHLTVYDTSDDVWSATGFGLFLDDGTLFAAYTQGAPVLEKAGLAFALLAFDIKFSVDVASTIEFGDALFTWPPATEVTRGIAKLATQARVLATADGEDDAETIVTPRTLRARLAALLSSVTNSVAHATEVTRGIAKLATQARVLAATDGEDDAETIVTPRTLRARVSIIDTAISGINGTIGTIQGAISGINGTIGTIQGAISGINGTIGTIQGAISGINDTIATIQGTVSNLVTDVTNLFSGLNALRNRSITGVGLIVGGGNLTADRTMTVPLASAADLQAASSEDVAVVPASFGGLPRLRGTTGYEVHPGGTLVQRGLIRTFYSGQQILTITFPVAFANTEYDLQLTAVIPTGGDYDNFWQEISGGRTASSAQIYLQDPSSGGDGGLAGMNWRAEGIA